MKNMARVAILALAFAGVGGSAQFISNAGQNRTAAKAEAVQYLSPGPIAVSAGKPAQVALHFRIAPGLHIQSHKPAGEFYIPTVFSIPADAGVKLVSATYPPGTTFRLPADPSTPLSVYTGEFAVQTRLVASPGDHKVRAALRYQACDQTQCMPPKTILVSLDVVGK